MLEVGYYCYIIIIRKHLVTLVVNEQVRVRHLAQGHLHGTLWALGAEPQTFWQGGEHNLNTRLLTAILCPSISHSFGILVCLRLSHQGREWNDFSMRAHARTHARTHTHTHTQSGVGRLSQGWAEDMRDLTQCPFGWEPDTIIPRDYIHHPLVSLLLEKLQLLCTGSVSSGQAK